MAESIGVNGLMVLQVYLLDTLQFDFLELNQQMKTGKELEWHRRVTTPPTSVSLKTPHTP